MLSHFCSLLGYTQDELVSYFDTHINELAKRLNKANKECYRLLKNWYNGYQFSSEPEKVYNRFSILNVLYNKEFRNYWFETGTPSFLANIIKEKNYHIPDIENLQLDEQSFYSFDLEHLKVEALLFQTGYITITGYEDYIFTISYPNQEVKKSFLNYLLQSIIHIPDAVVSKSFLLLHKYLKSLQYKEFILTVNTILASIPYTQDADRAIKQIKEKGYADKYKFETKSGITKQIILIGINFDTTRREVSGWKVESL